MLQLRKPGGIWSPSPPLTCRLSALRAALGGSRRPAPANLLPVLHACLIGHTLLQRQAVHLQEVLHVLNLSHNPLLAEPLQLGLVGGPGRRLIEPLVRVVAVDAAPDALAVRHREHLAAAAAATLPNAAARRCRFGDLQVFRRTVTGLARAQSPVGAAGVAPREHAPTLPRPRPPRRCRGDPCKVGTWTE